MIHALTRSVGTTRHVDSLPNKTRLVTVDGHPSNRKAEELYETVRAGWLAVLLLCELHIVAIIFRECLMSLSKDIARGTLYTALCLSHGEEMNLFRQCLYEEVMSDFRICAGAPPPDARAWRSAMLELFF